MQCPRNGVLLNEIAEARAMTVMSWHERSADE
jgi:hypothetical protein